MTQTLKDLKSMIYEGNSTLNEKTDAQVGIIQNSVRHSGVMKSVNALKSSFLDNPVMSKKNQEMPRMSTRGRAWNEPFNHSKYASNVLNTSLKRDHNASKNYSINSRINNPRPLNNLAKNLAANNIKNKKKEPDAEEKSQNSSFEHISMGSFEDRPSTVKNTKGLKKIQFDEIMKGISRQDQDSSKKSATLIPQDEDAVDGDGDQHGLLP